MTLSLSLSHGSFIVLWRFFSNVFIFGRKVIGLLSGDNRFSVRSRSWSWEPHHNEDDLHVSPGGHDQQHQEEEEDLGDIEGVVQHVRDEAEDQEDLEAHVDNQPGQQQHPLVISNSSTGQTENF